MEFGCGFGFGVRFVIVCFAMVGWFGWLLVVSVGLRYSSCLPIWYFCLGFLWVFEFCGFVLVAAVLVVCVLDCRLGLGLRVSMVFAFGLCVWGVVYVVVCWFEWWWFGCWFWFLWFGGLVA